MPRHAPPRTEIASSDSATRQVDQLTHEALGALDHALVAISINPALRGCRAGRRGGAVRRLACRRQWPEHGGRGVGAGAGRRLA